MYLIRTDTGLRFSTFYGWQLQGHTRFLSPFEARRTFEKYTERPNVVDPRYFIVRESTGEIVEELT